MKLDIHLGIKGNFTISYNLYDNDVSRLFLMRMSEQENKVVSRTQFYNFGETQTQIEEKLLDISEQLKTLGLIESTSQEDLNDLHENFPRLHEQHTGNTLELLREFNYCIHHLEDISRGFNSKRFLFTCEGDDGIDLPNRSI